MIPLHPWPEEFFENNSGQSFNFTNFLCPDVDELELSGNRFSDNSTFFSLQLSRWDERTGAYWNDTAMKQYFENMRFGILIKNQYFDYTNLSNPVQTYFSSSMDFSVSLINEK